jgi:hypothetical protein
MLLTCGKCKGLLHLRNIIKFSGHTTARFFLILSKKTRTVCSMVSRTDAGFLCDKNAFLGKKEVVRPCV